MQISPVRSLGTKPSVVNIPKRQAVQFGSQHQLNPSPQKSWLAPLVLAGMAALGVVGDMAGIKIGMSPVSAAEKKEASKIVKITSKNFEAEVLNAKVPVVLKFGAPWCPPCRAMQPELEKLAKEYHGKIKVAEVNTDEEPDLAAKYGVRGIPDTHLFKKKTEDAAQNDTVDHVVGLKTKNELKEWVKTHVPNLDEQSK